MIPGRGVVEANGTAASLKQVAASPQAAARELELLERHLTPAEARYVTEMTRRIAASLLLGPARDAHHEAVKANTYEWTGAGT